MPPPQSHAPVLTSAAAETAVAPSGTQKLKPAALWIGTKITAPASGRVTATTTGSVRIKGVKKAIKLKRVVKTLAAGQTATLKLKPQGGRKALARIKRAIRRGKKVTATIRVKLVDATGHTRTVKRTLRLK